MDTLRLWGQVEGIDVGIAVEVGRDRRAGNAGWIGRIAAGVELVAIKVPVIAIDADVPLGTLGHDQPARAGSLVCMTRLSLLSAWAV